MKHKLSKRILSTLLAMMVLVCLLSTSVLPVFAATIIGRDTISSVAITVGNLVAGEPLATCVPESTLCDITCTWAVRGRNGTTEVPASTIADAGTTYYLAMVLTPKLDLYTFADSVTGTVNGNTVTIQRISNTKVACMVSVSPVTRETEISVSVPQPAVGVIPGTPTAVGGHTVTDCTWWRSSAEAVSPETKLGENEVFSTNYDYYMEAMVTAASGSLFDESTAISVNGEAAEILERGTNTIRFRYHVDSSEVTTVASQVYVADGNGGYWTLTSGDTQTNGGGYTASYQDGVLTLSNTGESTISGFYNKSTLYYGIYAEGNLTVRFEGDFSFDLSGTPDTADHVYGIYVNGDLILINESADDCTVSFSPAEGILATTHSSGIYCGGALSVQNVGGGFTLNAHGVGVRPVNGAVIANFTNNGICAQGGITIGSNCTVNATAADVQLSAEGETQSRGIYAYGGFTIMKNAVVTATGGDINPSQSAETLRIGFSQYCYGVKVEGGDITVNGGTLTAIGGNIDYGDLTGSGNATYGQQESYGIYAGDITLNGGAITATAGFCVSSAFVTGSLSEGIFCYDLTVSSGTLTATAGDAWWESTGLHVRNNLSQTGGTINGIGGVAVCLQGNGTGSMGIYVVKVLDAVSGSLTGIGGTMGIQRPSVGLQAGTITLGGTAEVTGIGGLTTTDAIETPVTDSSTFASYPGDSIGVWTHNDLTVDGNAVLTAIGGTVKGDRSSAAQAMSIGLNFRLEEGFAISGSGTVIATGGETHYGSKGNTLYDSSCGIYGDVPSLTIDGTTVTATGGSVSTQTVSGNGVTIGGVSYGLYLPSGGLTLQNGAELTATGGENPNYSTLSTQPSKHNDSYGAYIKGDITVTNSVLTAIGGLSKRTVGLLHGGAVTLSGGSSRLTASADAYHSSAADEKYSYGAMNGSDFETWPGGAYTVNGGILILQGQTGVMSYTTNNTLTATTILRSANRDGSNPISVGSPANFSVFSSLNSKYVKADSNTVQVTISGWIYGGTPKTPTYTDYDGEPTILWTGITRAGASYSSDTAPTDAGDYTVTVTYPGGQTGSADFTVAPRPLTQCVWSLDDSELTYNGSEQTMGVTVSCGGEELVEGTDYTVSGNKQTNAGTYTLTINGIGNIEGARDIGFTIFKKRPTAEDFNIPEIVEYAYTGNPVELPLPTLKEGYTGVGTITLYYNSEITPPTDMGEYAVWFDVTEGDNFLNNHSLDYGTLVIRPAGFAVIVDIEDWTYGGTPKTPTYTEYDGEPTIRWTGTSRAGAYYSSDTAPTDAGDYTVTVTYPGGQTGSADFTVHPKQFIQYCGVSRNTAWLTYNGSEQTMGVTVNYGEEVLVEGVDYTVSGNKQTNAGTYTITVTGIGNLAGTKTIDFEIDKKFPTIDDFNIPEIAEYTYTGNPVELPLPTLKAPYTGGGTITLSYSTGSTQPTDMGEYTVSFRITGNTNFYDSDYFEYGTLVIKAADTTVSGTVTSFGSEIDDIVIALFAEGSATADYTVTVKGNAAAYLLEGVVDGTYTMKVNKHGHTEYTALITVDDTDLVHNVTLNLYQFGQTVQIRLIEPWGLKANARVHDGILANIDYSTLYSYGVYFIRASKLDREGVTAETITIADIIEDSDATHMTKGNGVTVENSGGQDRLTAIYDKGLYTYEFSDSVYVLFYIKPTESGEPVYAAIRERNLSQLVSQRKDQTSSFSAEERSVYLYMEKLEDDILSYRSDFVNPGVSPEQTAPTLEENPLSGSIASSSKYSFGHKVQVSLIEPWGIRLKARVYTSGMTSSQSIDYGELQDYGVIVLMDNNTTGFDNAEELLSRTDAYVFSANNGDVELEGNMIAANFTKDIYTYLLNSDLHVMFYVKDDEGYHFGPIKVRNLYELMLDRKEDTTGSYSEKEKIVYQDMVDLYTAITAYRASLGE